MLRYTLKYALSFEPVWVCISEFVCLHEWWYSESWSPLMTDDAFPRGEKWWQVATSLTLLSFPLSICCSLSLSLSLSVFNLSFYLSLLLNYILAFHIFSSTEHSSLWIVKPYLCVCRMFRGKCPVKLHSRLTPWGKESSILIEKIN